MPPPEASYWPPALAWSYKAPKITQLYLSYLVAGVLKVTRCHRLQNYDPQLLGFKLVFSPSKYSQKRLTLYILFWSLSVPFLRLFRLQLLLYVAFLVIKMVTRWRCHSTLHIGSYLLVFSYLYFVFCFNFVTAKKRFSGLT